MRFAMTISLAMMTTFARPATGAWKDTLWLGVEPGGDRITLRAISTGCTRKNDFNFEITADSVLNVIRIRPDLCRAKARFVEFGYSFDELGLSDRVYIQVN